MSPSSRSFRNRGSFSPALLAVEFFSILVAVILGFAVTEWREQRANASTADLALQSIAREMSQNCLMLAQRIEYHRTLSQQLDSLDAIGAVDLTSPVSELPAWSGPRIPLLRSSAYETTVAMGTLAYLPFETADVIGVIYEVQERVALGVDEGMRLMMSDPSGSVGSYYSLRGVIVGFGSELYDFYGDLGTEILSEHGFSCTPDADG